MTDYSWELQERAEQKSKFENHRDRNKLQTEPKKVWKSCVFTEEYLY